MKVQQQLLMDPSEDDKYCGCLYLKLKPASHILSSTYTFLQTIQGIKISVFHNTAE